MKNASLGFLAKKTIFFTKIIFTMSVLSIVLFINYLELREKHLDVRYLGMLSTIAEKGESQLQFQNFELERVIYLQKNHPQVEIKHLASRDALVNNLGDYGFNIDKGFKGRASNRNNFVLMTSTISNSPFEVKERDLDVYDYYYAINKNTPTTIDTALKLFNKLCHSENANVLVDYDTGNLIQQIKATNFYLDSIQKDYYSSLPESTNASSKYEDLYGRGDQPENYHPVDLVRDEYSFVNSAFSSRYQLKKVILVNDSLDLQFSELTGSSQRTPDEFSIWVKAKSSEVAFPPTLHFAGYDSNLVKYLARPHAQKRISKLYGYYGTETIKNIYTNSIDEFNKPISVLGFDVSRKWFPFSILILTTIILFLLYETLSTAKAKNIKILTSHISEDIFDFLINKKIIRFFVWVITPVLLLILLLRSSLIGYSILMNTIMYLCGLFSSVYGYLSFRLSLNL